MSSYDLLRLLDREFEPFLCGYLYANLVGSVLIWLVMRKMRKLVEHEPPKKYRWQPPVTGVIERTLYMISFLVGRPEFVVAWLAFKVAGGWQTWAMGKGDDEHKGRAMYSNMFNGSALSILYAGVGYLFIVWWKKFEVVISLAGILVGLTILIWIALKISGRKISKQNRCDPDTLPVTNIREKRKSDDDEKDYTAL